MADPPQPDARKPHATEPRVAASINTNPLAAFSRKGAVGELRCCLGQALHLGHTMKKLLSSPRPESPTTI